MFQSFLWNITAARVLGEREVPHVVFAESDHGSALIPAAVANSRLSLIGECMFDYRDVLTAGDPAVLKVAWSQAAALDLSFYAGAIRGDTNLASWSGFNLSRFYGAPLVSHRQITAADFASQHGRLGRWKRRLEREAVNLRCHTGVNTELVRHIYRQKGAQPEESGGSLFNDPKRVEFMVEICRTMGALCEIFTFESAGGLVAALVTFRDGGVRRFYTVYFEAAWAKYSPGMVLIYEVTRQSLQNSLDCDYMTGEHAYKMRFATSVTPMFWAEANTEMLGAFKQHRRVVAA